MSKVYQLKASIEQNFIMKASKINLSSIKMSLGCSANVSLVVELCMETVGTYF